MKPASWPTYASTACGPPSTAIEETVAGIVAEHALGEIVTSLPGIGTTLAAEFLAHAGTLTTYPSAAALAAHAGLAPISRDSGRRQGHQVRPHRYHRSTPGVQYVQFHDKTPYQPKQPRSAEVALRELA
ncbi:transposase [Micromonospora sp. NPDC049366]|uniref:transposase n=1 Tax=Micromonospora sp. NPDC049366 TaxID=3364271 RepID=UPI003799E759